MVAVVWCPVFLIAGGLVAGLVVPRLVAATVGPALHTRPTVVIAVAAAVITPLVAIRAPLPTLPARGALAIAAALLVALCVIDLLAGIVPHALTAGVAALGLVAGALTPVGPLPALSGLVVGGALFGLFYMAGRLLFGPGALGGGDVTLAAAVGAVTGYPLVFPTLAGGILLGGVTTAALLLAGRVRSGQAPPYGPYILVAALYVLTGGPGATSVSATTSPARVPVAVSVPAGNSAVQRAPRVHGGPMHHGRHAVITRTIRPSVETRIASTAKRMKNVWIAPHGSSTSACPTGNERRPISPRARATGVRAYATCVASTAPRVRLTRKLPSGRVDIDLACRRADAVRHAVLPDQPREVRGHGGGPAAFSLDQGHTGDIPPASGEPAVAPPVGLGASRGPMARPVALDVDQQQSLRRAEGGVGPVMRVERVGMAAPVRRPHPDLGR